MVNTAAGVWQPVSTPGRHRCDINAIDKKGDIDYDECIQCLECIVILQDEQQCAPLKVAHRRTGNATIIANSDTL